MTDTLLNILTTQVEKNPDRTALVYNGQEISFSALQSRSSQVASGLNDWGIRTQSRIAILDINSARYFEVLFASLMLNCAQLGINTRLAAPEVEYILNDSQAPVLFVAEPFYALIEKIEERLEHIQHIVALDGGHPRWTDYAKWRDKQSTAITPRSSRASDHVMQMYTSGTTGHPKGVCHSNYSWMKFTEASSVAGWASFGKDDVLLVAAPLFHVAGINPALVAFQSGAKAVIQKQFIPSQVLDLIQDHKITFTLLIPAMIQACLAVNDIESYDFSALKRMAYGGSPINEGVLRAAQKHFACDFIHLYGMTENCGGGTCLRTEDHLPGSTKLRSAGQPYPGSELRIVDEHNNDLEPGQVGEIIFKHAWVMQGYWKKPDATRDTVKGAWLYTGDAGYVDEDGYLYIHDRIKDMIVSGGENIYPAEVENVLFEHPAIADVAVIGVPDEKWGESVKAVVVLKPDTELDADEVISFARERIAAYKTPKSIDTIGALPRNASGKILKRELRAPYWTSQEREVC